VTASDHSNEPAMWSEPSARHVKSSPGVETCPAFDALVAFAARRLSKVERRTIVTHLARCEACRFTIAEATVERAAGEIRTTKWRGPVIWAAAATMAAATTLLLAFRYQAHQAGLQTNAAPHTSISSLPPALPSTTSTVVGAAQAHQAGLQTNAAPHTPISSLPPALPPTTSTVVGADSSQAGDGGGLFGADNQTTDLRGRVLPPTTVTDALAAYDAPAKSPDGINRPPTYLRARALSDQAMSDLAQWRRTRDVKDAIRAYDAAKRAVANDPVMSDARFSLALATEAVATSMRAESVRAWQQYLASDSTTIKADEARRHLRGLQP
jgi:hypothetical protein